MRCVARAYDNVYVPVEQDQKPDEALGRETTQFIVPEVGDVRLWNTEPLCDRGLVKTKIVDQFIQANRELHTKLPVLGIGKTKVLKNVPFAGNYYLTLFSANISPRSLPWPP